MYSLNKFGLVQMRNKQFFWCESNSNPLLKPTGTKLWWSNFLCSMKPWKTLMGFKLTIAPLRVRCFPTEPSSPFNCVCVRKHKYDIFNSRIKKGRHCSNISVVIMLVRNIPCHSFTGNIWLLTDGCNNIQWKNVITIAHPE